MLQRTQLKNHTLNIARNKSTGCLEWPLKDKFSDHWREVEGHWKDRIQYPTTSSNNAPSKYILPMFPYPSGHLHMGHMRVYSISDVIARYYRLNGYHVIHPIGWDAFGLPAENAAIERGVDPAEWTKKNISVMREQLKRLGLLLDWDREICTCNPDYYKWTQWIFLKLYEHGFASRVLSEVNWDPEDKTVLAAEQIDSSGRSWRSSAIAEKKKLKQWVIETPKYAKKLIDGLYDLRYDWKEVADIQMSWIGKCDVYRYKLSILDKKGNKLDEFLDLRISDPNELLKLDFLLLAPDHPFIPHEKRNLNEPLVMDSCAWNFITGRPIPLIVLPKNLFDFDKDNHTTKYFMKSRVGSLKNKWDKEFLKTIDLRIEEAPEKELSLLDINELAMIGGYGGYLTSSHLTDWVVSRQRAWGTPIPIILSKDGKVALPVPENQLPILSEIRGKEFSDDRLPNGVGIIETDTLDTFFDSSWYYLRYLDPKNSKTLVDRKLAEKYMPVNAYVGGVEHAAVHLFFARFISHFLHSIGITPCEEPFHRLIPQGIVRSRTFTNLKTGEYVKPENVEEKDTKFFDKATGNELSAEFEKMSKSKYNGVDPFDTVNEIGIDLARFRLIDAASPRSIIDWGYDHNRVQGLKNFFNRTTWAINAYIENRRKFGNNFDPASDEVERQYKSTYNYCVRGVSTCIEVLHILNSAVARLIVMTNELRKMDPVDAGKSKEIERCLHALVIMLQIFVPNTASEFWSALCSVPAIQPNIWDHNTELTHHKWPKIDADTDIELIVSAYQTQCSRVLVNRQTLESLSDVEIISLAKNHVHQHLFDCFKRSTIAIQDFKVYRKADFHVTIELLFENHVKEKDIEEVLKILYHERRRMKKDEKLSIPRPDMKSHD